MVRRGIAILTYNRAAYLEEMINSIIKTTPVDSTIVVCDDGSTDNTPEIVCRFKDVIYVRGANKGVGANRNRALATLQGCHFIAMIEDDLVAIDKGWFEQYEEGCLSSGIHHFCRVQDKEIPENMPEFTDWLQKNKGLTPIYAPSPRGDLVFITQKVIRGVGGIHADFKGAGYAHGEWQMRIVKANLIPHSLRWVDIKEARDKFVQKGDREGGRWMASKAKINKELEENKKVRKILDRKNELYYPIFMP